MIKITVFDGGCGGEIIAKYLADELQVAEVTSVIDWSNAPYEDRDLAEVVRLTERQLRPYIGKSNLIVLGGYTVALALGHLQRKFPEQKFVAVGVNSYRILHSVNYPSHVTALMNNNLIHTEFCKDVRESLPLSTFAVPDCSGWEELTNYNDLTKEILRYELGPYFELKPKTCRELAKEKARQKARKTLLESLRDTQDNNELVEEDPYKVEVAIKRKLLPSDVVLLLNTNLWDMNDEIETVFGYKVRVMDFREKLLHDVCAALELRGVHGGRSK